MTTLTERNQSRAEPITHNGLTMTLPQWSKHLGININTLRARKLEGWSVERMLSEPLVPKPKPNHKWRRYNPTWLSKKRCST